MLCTSWAAVPGRALARIGPDQGSFPSQSRRRLLKNLGRILGFLRIEGRGLCDRLRGRRILTISKPGVASLRLGEPRAIHMESLQDWGRKRTFLRLLGRSNWARVNFNGPLRGTRRRLGCVIGQIGLRTNRRSWIDDSFRLTLRDWAITPPLHYSITPRDPSGVAVITPWRLRRRQGVLGKRLTRRCWIGRGLVCPPFAPSASGR